MARRFRARVIETTAVVLVAGSLAACGEPSGLASNDPANPTKVRILTEQSLEPVVSELVDVLEADRDDIDLDVVTAGAPEFHDQVLGRNQDDKDENDLDVVVGSASAVDVLRAEQVLAGDPLVFGSDMLVIATPKGNPAGVEDLDAFAADASANTGVCDPETYLGSLANNAFARAGVDADPDFVGPNAIPILLRLLSGELDAGLVLRTQAATQLDGVSIIGIPEEYNRVQQYSIAAVRASPVIDDAVDWLASSAAAGEILSTHGLRDVPEES